MVVWGEGGCMKGSGRWRELPPPLAPRLGVQPGVTRSTQHRHTLPLDRCEGGPGGVCVRVFVVVCVQCLCGISVCMCEFVCAVFVRVHGVCVGYVYVCVWKP